MIDADAHYRFPPARAYRLNRCLYALKSDATFRGRYLSDPGAAMTELHLTVDEQAAVRAGDRDTLLGLGAHAYLVFMADLQLRMAQGSTRFEYF